VVGIVQLDEGVSIMGRIVDVDPNEPKKIEIDMRVKAVPIQENEKTVLAFKPLTARTT